MKSLDIFIPLGKLPCLKLTLRLQPHPEIFQLRIHLFKLRNIGLISLIMKPLEHIPHVLHRSHKHRTKEPERPRNRLPCPLLKYLLRLLIRQLIPCQRNSFALVLLGFEKRIRRKIPNVTRCYHLEWLPLQRHVIGRHEDLAKEAGDEILVEGGGAEDRPLHFRVLGLVDEMVLDIIFVDKMRDFGGVFEGVCSAVDGAIDEVFDVLFERFVD